MTIAQIEENIKKLIASIKEVDFIYEFLLAFGNPKATIARLQSGKINLGEIDGELIWKKKLIYRQVNKEVNLLELIQNLREDIRLKKVQPRFIIVTNLEGLLAVDIQTQDTLDCLVSELDKHFDFFLPLAGIEKAQYLAENPADVKAAEKMAKLYDQINLDNEFKTEEEIHQLNVFLSRLLFCFFAEDTGIFDDKLFTNAISSNTKADASDTQEFLRDLFIMLNTADVERTREKQYLHKFPYVNGGLFRVNYPIPSISAKSRTLILESGNLDWSAINPDIFGSMIQAVVTTDKRGGLGMHYTSVPNIMKVINPLFLDELNEEYQNAKGNVKQLNGLIQRISKIKIFDPACGSGNFLIIAYKKLRELEIQILNDLNELKGNKGSGTLDFGSFNSLVSLNNFYGIEIDDFAHEIARLSLWLAEHQMNQAFRKEFGHSRPALPLKESGKIVRANACRIEWEEVCPKGDDDEIYILGNPPYLGYSRQNESQKKDLSLSFNSNENCKKLDYIAVWFNNASIYIRNSRYKFAFVSTNSITQGEQIGILFPIILERNQEICFAHKSFKWENNAKKKAGVAVVILGIRNISNFQKYIFTEKEKIVVTNINPYLIDFKNLVVGSRQEPLSKFPSMIKGSSPGDDGNLLCTKEEKIKFEELGVPKSFFKNYIGASEFMNKGERYCIYINQENLKEALQITPLVERFNKVQVFRFNSKKKSTQTKGNEPYFFDENKYQSDRFLLIPQTGSERRYYLPIGFFDKSYLPSNAVRVIYGEKYFWFMSILSSRIHLNWVQVVAGRLKNDMQYSNTLCYNTFPFPKIGKEKEKELEECAYRILEVRERYPEKTLAQLYDPDKMPDDLREAHRLNDLAVESCYREKPFESDEERLEHLFKLYEKMIAAENKK